MLRGLDASEDEKAAARAHLAQHYAQFERVPPWEKGFAPESLGDYALLDRLQLAAALLGRDGMEPETVRGLVDTASKALHELSAAAEPPEEALTAQERERERHRLALRLKRMQWGR